MSITVAEDAHEVHDEVVKGDSKLNWMSLTYADNQNLKVAGSGEGGLEECVASFGDDILFCFIRVAGTDKNGENRRLKFVLISYVPPTVKGLKKARCSMHVNDVKKFYRFQHVILQIGEAKEASKEDVVDKLNKTGGSDTSEVWIFVEE